MHEMRSAYMHREELGYWLSFHIGTSSEKRSLGLFDYGATVSSNNLSSTFFLIKDLRFGLPLVRVLPSSTTVSCRHESYG